MKKVPLLNRLLDRLVFASLLVLVTQIIGWSMPGDSPILRGWSEYGAMLFAALHLVESYKDPRTKNPPGA